MKAWKKLYIIFLVLFGVVGIIMKDYLITGFLLSSNFAFLIDPKKSRTAKTSQLMLLCIAILSGCVYLYLKIRLAGQ